MTNPIGTHIIGDLLGCNTQHLFSLDMQQIKSQVSSIIKKYGMHELGSYYHLFENNSFTGIIALAESHVSFHTWPELGVVNMDVYTCNFLNDNTDATRKIFDEIANIFAPININRKEIQR